MSDMLAEALPEDIADPALLVRAQLITIAWALAAAVRSAALIAPGIDAVGVLNRALEEAAFSHRLQPLN